MGRNTKPTTIDLDWGEPIPILYEDRTVLAVDKPRGWMLAPGSWTETDRNLQAALVSSIAEGGFWARSRNLKFLRYVHRLDAETTGVLLFAKSPGALEPLSALFESRTVGKVYLAVVRGVAKDREWICDAPLSPFDPATGRVTVDKGGGKPSETWFQVLATDLGKNGEPLALVEARPSTGRTHQIRVHLESAGLPVFGDSVYGASLNAGTGRPRAPQAGPAAKPGPSATLRAGQLVRAQAAPVAAPVAPLGDFVAARRKQTGPLGLRSVQIAYADPFTRRRVQISAPVRGFLKEFGFGGLAASAPGEHAAFHQFLDRLAGPKPPPRPADGAAGKSGPELKRRMP